MLTASEKLAYLRNHSGSRLTEGLSEGHLDPFLRSDPKLVQAIDRAYEERIRLQQEWGDWFQLDEGELVTRLQEGLLNFYTPETVNPYVPLAAQGPWIVTSHGAVLHDSGGYGMLGFGHAPEPLLAAMSQPYVMANVMTASFAQRRLIDRLRKEVGHQRGSCPFSRFFCLNSGSESVTLALRIADAKAFSMTRPGGAKAGQRVKLLALQGAFHGRTDRPAQASHSTRPKYLSHLASFQAQDNLVVVPPNDVEALIQAFEQADREGVFFEAMLCEPVMGEGNPGLALSRPFYDAARRLTRERGTLLLIDSIQAGLRTHGVLSLVDYPGFTDCSPPDMETYSKALNGGQYPLSVLAVGPDAEQHYHRGLYGNTMTTNPRALEVACAALDGLTPERRQNIVDRGAQLLEALRDLQRRHPRAVRAVNGTGLLCAAELDPVTHPVVGADAVEPWCRRNGLGVIHGGKNAIRLTPHFDLTEDEVQLIARGLDDALRAFTTTAALAQPALSAVPA